MKARIAAALTGLALGLVLLASPARAQTAPPVPPGPPLGSPGSLMDKVIPPTACPGSASAGPGFSMSAYTIDYDEGALLAVSRKTIGTLTEMTFAMVRWLVAAGSWLVAWAFSFGFANQLAAPMSAVAGRYQAAFFLPFVGSALMISAAYGGLEIFRGRMGRGLGEFALSVVLVAAFSTWLLSQPASFLDTSLRTTARLSGSVSSVALGSPSTACATPRGSFSDPGLGASIAPLTEQIRRSFVEQPYELLEWGTQVPPGCTAFRDAVLAAPPGGDRNRLVSVMNVPGCETLYRFNRDPSTERLGVALLVLVAAAVLVVCLGLVAGSVVTAQVAAVGLIALTPLAALAAALPGAGRAAMWRWAAALLRALLTILVMSTFLTFLLLATDTLLSHAQGQSLLAQMAMLNVVAILGIGLRKRLLGSGHRAITSATRRLEAGQRFRSDAVGPAFPAHRLLELQGDALAPRVAGAIARARVSPAPAAWPETPG